MHSCRKKSFKRHSGVALCALAAILEPISNQAPLPTPIAVDVHDATHLESDECAILLLPEQQRGEQAAEIRQMTDDHQVAGFIL